MVITLRAPVRVAGPYGITREAIRIGVAVDDPIAFLATARERIG